MANRTRQIPQVDVLKCRGDLNASCMVSIKNKLTRLMNRKHRYMLLDLEKTKHIDLAGLGILVERLRKVRSLKGDIKLCNLRPQVSETFRMVGVSKLIDSYSTKEEALESFKSA